MKLRNKKTGEITDLAKRGLLKSDNDNHIIVYPEGTLKYYAYDSLAELNEEWEDYKSAEPLIKDDKIRKAVKAWAEAINTACCVYDDFWKAFRYEGCTICFKDEYYFDGLVDEVHYAIAELCGEDGE